MKRTLLLLLVALPLAAGTAAADAVGDAYEALQGWDNVEAVEATADGTTLTVVLAEEEIDEKTYNRVMMGGFCAYVDLKLIQLYGVRAIAVINRDRSQGYVFQGGALDCVQLNQLTRRQANNRLMDMTRDY